MPGNLGDSLQLGLIWMVVYGMLAFGWVQLRQVYRAEGGLIFGAFFYLYTTVAGLGIAWILAKLGLPLIGIDPGFLQPVEVVVGSLSSVVQIMGVLAVTAAIFMYAYRFFQGRRENRRPSRPANPPSGRQTKRKSGRM